MSVDIYLVQGGTFLLGCSTICQNLDSQDGKDDRDEEKELAYPEYPSILTIVIQTRKDTPCPLMIP